MAEKFGFLSRISFLQDWASRLVSGTNPAVIHNLEKYYILKKVYYLSAIEDGEGDYLEFGVFTGSSFCHSMRCAHALKRLSPKLSEMRFFGFDSFAGFGALDESDKHPFYTDENFETSIQVVNQRVRKVARGLTYKLVPGFFNASLKAGAASMGITKSRIVFIDSDTYSSARDALTFTLPTVQEGTFIILDDYYSYKGSAQRGVAAAFSEFLAAGSFEARHVFTYGMGGSVYVIAKAHV